MKLLKLACAALLASSAMAEAQQVSSIDTQLAQNLDFRELRFSACFGQPVCEVDGYRVIAWHRHSDRAPWHAARLYWDPVDGLGIQGGGQDDEIDYNERLIVEFPFQRGIHGVWITDLFINEVGRYTQVSGGADKAAETAGVEMRLNGVEPARVIVSGDIDLPPRPFNAMIAPDLFTEGGDLRQRLVISDGAVSILSAALNATGERTVLTTIPINQLEGSKRDEIIGDDGVSIDLSALLGEDLEVPLEREGSRNADRISAILENQLKLGEVQAEARVTRSVGNVPNGEVSAAWEDAVPATSVMFHAPEGTSNDYSVAGILFQPVSQ